MFDPESDTNGYTQDQIDGFGQHHTPRRHQKRNEVVLPECPYGKCKLIDNEFVELCEVCERDEKLHHETIKGNTNAI